MKRLLASIDIGAHSARLLIVEVDPDSSAYRTIEELETPVPLGTDVFRSGRISQKSLIMMCGIMENFRAKLDEYRITEYKAIATSAVREAENAEVFIERIRHITGIEVKIFSGTDEARILHLALRTTLPENFKFYTSRCLLADIGTGACQVTAYDRGIMQFTETVRLGTLRASEMLSDVTSSTFRMAALQPMIDAAFSSLGYVSGRMDCGWLVLTGSSVRALFSILGGRRKKLSSLSIKDFVRLSRTVENSTVETLCKNYSLRPDIAEAVLPCCMTIASLCRISGASHIAAPDISTKSALVNDTVSGTSENDPFETQIFGMSALTARRFGCDSDLTVKTAYFAQFLFENLTPVHGLGHRSLTLLKVAALLCRTGLFISNQAYHKHSYYIIRNTEIPGLSDTERQVAALVARYHRKSKPAPQHPEFSTLAPDRRSEVTKLAAILRVACGLAQVCDPGDKISVTEKDGDIVIRTSRATVAGKSTDSSLFTYVFAKRLIFA